MKSSWNDDDAKHYLEHPLALRAYTSRLLGLESGLVLHGGGNTSVKITEPDFFGALNKILYVKGSGWDLASIQPPGFAPVRMDSLERLAQVHSLSDTDMVREQRSAMTDPNAPNPSVEAILHGIIPFTYVDHSHSDAVVTISNTPNGNALLQKIYGERVLLIPYVMPGFKLARAVWEQTRDIDWSTLDGMILLHHGVFTFGETARESYERMIDLVSKAEEFLRDTCANSPIQTGPAHQLSTEDVRRLAEFRKEACQAAGRPLLARFNGQSVAQGFSRRSDAASLSTRGPLTPDHVIHTKRTAAILDNAPGRAVHDFVTQYHDYFEANNDGTQTQLDPAPRWALWQNRGTVSMGVSVKRLQVVHDIIDHTIQAFQWGETLGGWTALSAKDIFDVEYWELEQAKLKKAGNTSPYQGRVALVTGAAGGIGAACVEALEKAGAAIVALDILPMPFSSPNVLPLICDVTDPKAIQQAIQQTVSHFGGLDILISNAGSFPENQTLDAINPEDWSGTLALNLTSHQRLLTAAAPFLEQGVDPTVIIVGSKNVPAPGPGVSAYSAAKAGLTQLARVAALEWGPKGIRVNTLHPNGVFDTGIWNSERIQSRAESYGMTPEEYRSRNVLGVEVNAGKVAQMAVAMAGPLFSCTTGAQIPVDGGNDRVI